MYGPYVRVVHTGQPSIRPVHTGELFDTRTYEPYWYQKMHPYIRAVFTGSAYRPLAIETDTQTRPGALRGPLKGR